MNWLYDLRKLSILVVTMGYLIGMLIFAFNDKNKAYLLRSDFSAYFTGAKIVSMGLSKELFNFDLQDQIQEEVSGYALPGVLPFRNPPVTAWLYSALTAFEPIIAYRVYLIVNTAVTFFTILLICRYIKLDSKYFLLSIWSLPVIATLYNAQISSFLFLFYTLVYICFKEKRFFLAGLISALIFLKLQHLIIIPYFFILAEKRWRYLAGFLGAVAVLVAACYLMYGSTLAGDFFRFTIQSEAYDFGTFLVENYTLISFVGFFQRTNYGQHIHLIMTGVTLLILAITYLIYFKNYKKYDFADAFSAAVIFSIALNLHALYTDLIFLTVPFLLLAKKYSVSRRKELKNLLILLFLLPWLGFLRLQGIVATAYIYMAFSLIDIDLVKLIRTRKT